MNIVYSIDRDPVIDVIASGCDLERSGANHHMLTCACAGDADVVGVAG